MPEAEGFPVRDPHAPALAARVHGRAPPIFEVARELLGESWKGEPVRLIGVMVSSLARPHGGGSIELFQPDEKRRRLREAVDRVRDRLGESSLIPAGSLVHRRELGHVPFGALSVRVVRSTRSPIETALRHSKKLRIPDP